MVNEKEFWTEVRKDIPKYKNRKPRVVPAFTIQALQVSRRVSLHFIHASNRFRLTGKYDSSQASALRIVQTTQTKTIGVQKILHKRRTADCA